MQKGGDTMKAWEFDCFDLFTGMQNITFYGVGNTYEEAKQDANIPDRYEINDVYEIDSVDFVKP